MIIVIDYVICFIIIFAILLYIYGWVAESEREIAEEEAERKYRTRIRSLEDQVNHPRTALTFIGYKENDDEQKLLLELRERT